MVNVAKCVVYLGNKKSYVLFINHLHSSVKRKQTYTMYDLIDVIKLYNFLNDSILP